MVFSSLALEKEEDCSQDEHHSTEASKWLSPSPEGAIRTLLSSEMSKNSAGDSSVGDVSWGDSLDCAVPQTACARSLATGAGL